MEDITIKLKNIGKEYLISHQKPTLIENVLGKKTSEKFWALKNINLTIKKGERIGIVGPNGAGKTTLFKIIAGITEPTAGEVSTNGKVVALIDLDGGFHPELTGEENIFLNGMIVGMTKEKIEDRKRQIIEFADIGDFISAPFYTYSAGMKFRLAFSVAIASECDILLIDEIFAAGDRNFQRKIYSSLNKFQKNKDITTVITSHVSFFIWDFAQKFYMLEKGKMKPLSPKKMDSIMREERLGWKKAFPILKNI